MKLLNLITAGSIALGGLVFVGCSDAPPNAGPYNNTGAGTASGGTTPSNTQSPGGGFNNNPSPGAGGGTGTGSTGAGPGTGKGAPAGSSAGNSAGSGTGH